MKLKHCWMALLVLLLYPSLQAAEWEIRNPILPNYHADPHILYSEKTHQYYIYSTTDGKLGWGSTDFGVFSSKNLKDWKDRGRVLEVEKGHVDWASGYAWAPCVVEKKVGKKYMYYFYYSARNPHSGHQEIGCAIGDSPTGPFTDIGASIITDGDMPKGCEGMTVDVDVFLDPASGKYYIYWGCGFLAAAELDDDMVTIKSETIVNLTPEGGSVKDHAYHGGPHVFWRDSVYYFLWSVDEPGSDNCHVAYGTSTSPLGPIKVANQPSILWERPERELYGTGNCSVLKGTGKSPWYIVYHRIDPKYRTRRRSPGTHRQVCIDRLVFAEDGTILPIEPSK